jgi:hypothetical protein
VDGIGSYKDGRRARLNASRGYSNPAGDETTAASSPRAQHHSRRIIMRRTRFRGEENNISTCIV